MRSKCENVLPLLSDYSEGLLSEKDCSFVEEHLNVCSECSTERDFVESLLTGLSSLEEDEAPQELCSRVLSSIKSSEGLDEPQEAGLWHTFLRVFSSPRYALAGITAVILLFVFLSPVTNGGRDKLAKAETSGRASDGLCVSGGIVEVDGIVVDSRKSSLRIEKGQELAIRRASQVDLLFEDGSTVLASRHAFLEVMEDGLLLKRGRLDLSMSKTGVGFIVETPHADVIVRGTRYSVEVGKATRVSVSEGSVAVESRLSSEQIDLGAGDKVSVLPDGSLRKRLTSHNEGSYHLDSRKNAANESEDTSLLGLGDED